MPCTLYQKTVKPLLKGHPRWHTKTDCWDAPPPLTLLHSEQPKLYRVLAVLSVIGLKQDLMTVTPWDKYDCTQVSLLFYINWAESYLLALLILQVSQIVNVRREDVDQTLHMNRLISVYLYRRYDKDLNAQCWNKVILSLMQHHGWNVTVLLGKANRAKWIAHTLQG